MKHLGLYGCLADGCLADLSITGSGKRCLLVLVFATDYGALVGRLTSRPDNLRRSQLFCIVKVSVLTNCFAGQRCKSVYMHQQVQASPMSAMLLLVHLPAEAEHVTGTEANKIAAPSEICCPVLALHAHIIIADNSSSVSPGLHTL